MSAIGEVSLITNCAPATGSFVAPGSSTTTSSDTVSPGSASFVPICHAIAPSGTVTGVDVVVSDSVVVSVDSGVVLSVSVTVVLVVVSSSVASEDVPVVVVSVVVVVVALLTLIPPLRKRTLLLIFLPSVSET